MRSRCLVSAVLTAIVCGGCGAAPLPVRRTWRPDEPRGFNQLALRLDEPLYWTSDANSNRAPDPDEVCGLLFYPTSDTVWVQNGAFTPAFERERARIVAAASEPRPSDRRRALVEYELDQNALVLIDHDLRTMPETDRAFVGHMLRVAQLVDALYARQAGTDALAPRLDRSDPLSASFFRRNWGGRCSWALIGDPSCAPIAGAPRLLPDLYPPEIQDEHHAFCADVARDTEEEPGWRAAGAEHTVVRWGDDNGARYRALRYSSVYADLEWPIAAELRIAASGLGDPIDAPLAAYLRAAADGFESDVWGPAMEAWDQLGHANARWLVSVGTAIAEGFDPCGVREAFRFDFGRMVTDGGAWREPILALEDQMVAAGNAAWPSAAGRRYPAPSFDDVDVLFVAGDDRRARGAVGGDGSLMRTVTYSNVFTDAASRAARSAQSAAIFTTEVGAWSDEVEWHDPYDLLARAARGIVSARYATTPSGTSSEEALGQEVAASLHTLRRRAVRLWLVEWLREHGAIDEATARGSREHALLLALRWMATGTHDRHGDPMPGVAGNAIWLGLLLERGALRWDATATSFDGAHHGALVLESDRLPTAIRGALDELMRIANEGDRAAYDRLASRYVDGDGLPLAEIRTRFQAVPAVSYVFSLQL